MMIVFNFKALQGFLNHIYELAQDYEVLRLQFYKLSCRCRIFGFRVEPYGIKDMLKTPMLTRFGKWFSDLLANELFAEELVDEPTDDKDEEQISVLQEIRKDMQKLIPNHHSHSARTELNRNKKKH
jgi:hypothetical protein